MTQQSGQPKSLSKYNRKIHGVDGDFHWQLVTFVNTGTCHTLGHKLKRKE